MFIENTHFFILKRGGYLLNLIKKLKNLKSKSSKFVEDNKVYKQPKDKRKLPQSRGNGKGLKVIIWIVIVFIAFSGVLALMRSQNALNKSKNAQQVIAEIKEGAGEHDKNDYSSPKLEVYANRFVDVFMNVPKDKKEERKAQLSKLYAKGFKLDESTNFEGYRKLLGKQLYDVTYEKDYAVLKYRVSYENVKIEKKQVQPPQKDPNQPPPPPENKEEEVKKQHVALLNIPISSKNGKYAVIENPYFTPQEELQANDIKSVVNPLSEKEQLKFDKKEPIEKWLNEFFVKYADSKASDMSYMMAKPQALSGIKSFVKIEELNVYPTKQKDTFTVKTVVKFKEKDIDLESNEVFSLQLKLKDGKYFVENLKNTLGGK